MDTQLSPWFTQSNPGPAPVAPGFVQASTDAGRSIMQGTENLGGDILEAVKQHKQNVQDQSDVDTAFPMVVKQMATAGIAPDPSVLAKFGTSSLSAKKGMIGALATQYATTLKAKTDQASIDKDNAMTGYYNDTGAARVQKQNEDTADDAGMASVFSRFVTDPAAAKTTPPETLSVLKAFAGPNINPRVQAQVMRSVLPSLVNGDGSASKPKFIQLGDNKIPVIYGKGGQFQIDPAYSDNLKAQNAKDLLDYKTQTRQKLLDAGLKPAAVAGKEIPNVYQTSDGKVIDLRSEMEKAMGGGTPSPAAGPQAVIQPQEMGGYKIGTVYKGGLKYIGGDPTQQTSWQKQ